MPDARQLLLGTAGHIDHGKSRLVLALTGTDPDRLPEEKARGMTIDLGFAHLPLDGADVWLIDVPGHERFIRNMVAGATGIDGALLVVAADDSVMPQTREHAELLALLGVSECIVALTKMDLVDDEWAEQVELEVAELLRGLGLTPRAFVRTSCESGRGLDDLRGAIVSLAEAHHRAKPVSTWFRLPIDRAFTAPGRGTVVTGSVFHGRVHREEELELLPAGRRVRVRELQSHSTLRDDAAGRMRLALNLAGVPLDDVGRGRELATPGYLRASRCCDVRFSRLRMPGKQLRARIRARLHLATSEVLAEIRLPAKPADVELRAAIGQLIAAEPIVAAGGQPFVIRDESGARTLGGGRVLLPLSRPWTARRPPQPDVLERLEHGDEAARLAAAVRLFGWECPAAAALAACARLPDAAAAEALSRRLCVEGRAAPLDAPGGALMVHADVLREAAEGVVARVRGHLEANPREPGIPRAAWAGWMPRAAPQRVRAALAAWMIARGLVVEQDGHVMPPGAGGALPPPDAALLDQLLRAFDAAGFQPPRVEELSAVTSRNARRAGELIEWAAARGRLVRVADGMWLHAARWDQLVTLVRDAITQRGPLPVSEIRTLLGSSRKYVVPIVERLDALHITRRQGDLRALGDAAAPRG